MTIEQKKNDERMNRVKFFLKKQIFNFGNKKLQKISLDSE